MSFFKAIKTTLFMYIPHCWRVQKTEGGAFGLKPFDWFFWYWGYLMNAKHNKRIQFLKAR